MPEACPRCSGRGFLVLDDGSAHTCPCRVVRGWVLDTVRIVGQGRIERFGRGLCPDGAPLQGSFVIHHEWPRFVEDLGGWVLSHVRAGYRPTVRVLTCVSLRNLYLGAGQDGAGISTLREDLVVVRLLGIENKMTVAALIEAVATQPMVWLVSPPGHRYGPGHPSWSPEVAELIQGWPVIDLATAPDPKGAGARMGMEDANA